MTQPSDLPGGYNLDVRKAVNPPPPPGAPADWDAPLPATTVAKSGSKSPSDMTDDELREALLKADASFKDRFAASADTTPKENAPALKAGVRRAADLKIARDDTHGEVDAALTNFANTAALNIPRNIGAFILAHKAGIPFSQAYETMKDSDEAGDRLNRKSAIAGTVAGIGAGAAVLPGIGGGVTTGARAVRAAATGAGYGGVAEAFDSKDPTHVAVATALGAGLGLVLAPAAEKIVGLVSAAVKAGKTATTYLKPDGTLTDEAVAAAKGAGIDPADLGAVLRRSYADKFEKKGATPSTAREAAADEFGVKLTPGEATGNYGTIAREQAMAADAHGPVAGKKARDFFDERGVQVEQAKGGMQARVADQQPMVGSVNEAANTAGAGVRSEAGRAKAGYKGAYDDALAREGDFATIAFDAIGERIRRDGLKGNSPVVIGDRTTPVAAAAIQHLDNNIGRLRIQDRAEPFAREARTAGDVRFPGEPPRVGGATQDPGLVVGVNMKGVEQARKELVSFYKSAKATGNAEDIRAMRRIIAGFDDELETAIATGLFKGDDGALPALKEARRLFSNYQKTFRSQGAGDAVGKSMERIVERDATGGDIANLLYGKAAIGEKGDAVKLAGRLKQVLGPNSEEWSAVRQGLWLRLTSKPEGMDNFGPQALAERIFKFTNGDGADMARAMFTPKELGEMRRFATVMKTIVPPKGTTNPSGSAWALMREAGIGTGVGLTSLWLTNDPATSVALAGVKVGSKLASNAVKGFKAARHFAAGAPTTPAAVAAGRSRGPAAGLAGAKGDDYLLSDDRSAQSR